MQEAEETKNQTELKRQEVMSLYLLVYLASPKPSLALNHYLKFGDLVNLGACMVCFLASEILLKLGIKPLSFTLIFPNTSFWSLNLFLRGTHLFGVLILYLFSVATTFKTVLKGDQIRPLEGPCTVIDFPDSCSGAFEGRRSSTICTVRE